MKIETIAFAVILMLVVIGTVLFAPKTQTSNGGTNSLIAVSNHNPSGMAGNSNVTASGIPPSGPATTSTHSVNSSAILFANTVYAQYAYLIAPGALTQQAKFALAGFNVSAAQLNNGSAQVKLSLVSASQSQSLILKPGYKLYIIETTFGDDGFQFDSSLGDDGFVLVDSNGYVV